jgi:hypothetical protein
MPIWGRPRGTLILNQPTWRVDELCVASHSVSLPGPAAQQYISVYNNDNSGRLLVVWALLSDIFSSNTFFFYQYQGIRGSFVKPATNINPLGNTPPVNVYYDQPAGQYGDVATVASGNFFAPWPSLMPSLIIPPTWSLAFGGDLASNQIELAIWFMLGTVPTGLA